MEHTHRARKLRKEDREGVKIYYYNSEARLVGSFYGDIEGTTDALNHAPRTACLMELVNNNTSFCGSWRIIGGKVYREF